MLSLYPDPASEENKFAQTTKDQLVKAQQKDRDRNPAKSANPPGGKSNQ